MRKCGYLAAVGVNQQICHSSSDIMVSELRVTRGVSDTVKISFKFQRNFRKKLYKIFKKILQFFSASRIKKFRYLTIAPIPGDFRYHSIRTAMTYLLVDVEEIIKLGLKIKYKYKIVKKILFIF